jgi:hypothetical protein
MAENEEKNEKRELGECQLSLFYLPVSSHEQSVR